MVSGGAIKRQRSKSDDAERPGQRRPAVFIAIILLALLAAADEVIEQASRCRLLARNGPPAMSAQWSLTGGKPDNAAASAEV
jgi:hypothetical protein